MGLAGGNWRNRKGREKNLIMNDQEKLQRVENVFGEGVGSPSQWLATDCLDPYAYAIKLEGSAVPGHDKTTVLRLTRWSRDQEVARWKARFHTESP